MIRKLALQRYLKINRYIQHPKVFNFNIKNKVKLNIYFAIVWLIHNLNKYQSKNNFNQKTKLTK